MSLFAPLRGLSPSPAAAADVVELPYDVMDRSEAAEMAAGRPFSFLHVSRPDIDLPEGARTDDPAGYQLAADALARMVGAGVLQRDTQPMFRVHRMTDGGHVQTGVVGLASVAAYDAGRIRRHESTRPDKQADRAAHLEAVNAQTGPVLLIHEPSAGVAEVVDRVTSGGPAPTRVTGPSGVGHELWPVAGPQDVAALVTGFEALPALYIADGHHRSAAASVVHGHRRSQTSAGFLATAFPSDQVRILPYHRVVRAEPDQSATALLAQIALRFRVEPADGPVAPSAPGHFGLYLAGHWYELIAADHLREVDDPAEQLDVAILQRHLLAPVLGIGDPRTDPRIGFVGGVRPVTELTEAVDAGRWTAAITVHATGVADLLAVADAGGSMPPKSTWFEPKLLDGFVCHVLD